MKENKKIKILIAAGGTGGHLFPALAVADKIQEILGEKVEFIFFGRKDKIEGRVIPQAGYRLVTTKLTGITKSISLNTLQLPLRLINDVLRLRKLIKTENIVAVICAGAYLSYPAGIAASMCNVKLYLMESNVNLGKALKMLIDRATTIFTTFKDTENYIDEDNKHKIKNYGNPVRNEILTQVDKDNTLAKFGLEINKPTVLIFGGSLGAKAINNAIVSSLDVFSKSDYQILWQCGIDNDVNCDVPSNIHIVKFIDDMASAYSAADLVVARSGATTVAELTIVGKPAVLIPLPSASNNEQMFNAKYLENENAAIVIENNKIAECLFPTIDTLIKDSHKISQMSAAAKSLGRPLASYSIANEVIKNLGV